MTCLFRVTNLETQYKWEQNLYEGDLESVKELTKFTKTAALWKTVIFPIRTNTLTSLLKDLFCPLTLQVALKVQDTTKRIFAVLGAAFVDLATFPIRLATLPWRLYLRRIEEPNPFKLYLAQEGASEAITNSDYLRVHFEWKEPSSGFWIDARSVRHENHHLLMKEDYNANLVEMPYYIGHDYRHLIEEGVE